MSRPVIPDDVPTPGPALPGEDLVATYLERVAGLVVGGRLADAEAETLRALALAPEDVRALKLLALIRFKLGRHAEARETYHALARLTPEDAGVHLNIGLIALKLDWIDEAIAELETAARLAPAETRSWNYLGFAYARAGRREAAAEAFRRSGDDAQAAAALAGDPHAPMDASADAGHPVPESGVSPAASGMSTPRSLADAFARASGDEGEGASGEVEGFAPSPTVAVAEASAPHEANLTGFLLARLLPGDDDAAVLSGAPLQDGTVRLALDGTAHVRRNALVAADGEIAITAAQRRAQGRLLGEALGREGAGFYRCSGQGALWLSAPAPGSLLVLHLEDDVFFLREDRALGFSDPLVWESGRLPGDGLAMLQMRGTGIVLVDIEPARVRAFKLPPQRRCQVERGRLLGWVGRVVAQVVPGGGGAEAPANPAPAGHLISCEGEGVLLLCTHGYLEPAVPQSTESGDHGTGPADPGGPGLHR